MQIEENSEGEISHQNNLCKHIKEVSSLIYN